MSTTTGQLNYFVTLRRPTAAQGDMGAMVEGTPTQIAQAYARRDDLSSREVMEYSAQGQLNSRKAARFTLLRTADTSGVIPSDELVSESVVWNILTTRAIENDRWLELLCETPLTL